MRCRGSMHALLSFFTSSVYKILLLLHVLSLCFFISFRALQELGNEQENPDFVAQVRMNYCVI